MSTDKKEKGSAKGNSIIGGVLWSFGERISAQLVTVIVSIVLGRLLSPDEYAVVGIVIIFVSIANVFVTSGFGNSLIQKLSADELDFSTIFYFSLSLSIVLYIIMFFCAPIISSFYDMPDLTLILRVMSLRIIIASVNTVQHAYISRKMQFKKFFFSTITGTIASAVIGVVMAFAGFGVWALVAQYISNVTIGTVVLWFRCGWRPKRIFSFERLKGLYSYGWKILVSDLLYTLFEQFRGLALSKVISPTALSYYNQGKKFPELFICNIELSLRKVLMPYLSKAQEDKEHVLQLTRKSMRVSIFMMWPLLAGLAAVSSPLIEIVYTSKWLPCVPYMEITCFTLLMHPFLETHARTMKALGRSDLFAKMSAVRYGIGAALLVIAIVFYDNPFYIVGSWTISMIIASVLCAFINRSLIEYGFKRQFKDMGSTLLSCIVMFVSVSAISALNLSLLPMLCIQVIVGVIVYIGMSWLINRKELYYLIELVKDILKKATGKK